MKRSHFVASAFASIAILPAGVRAAEFNLSFGNTEPIGTPANVRGRQAFDRIRKESNGRVNIQMFPNNVLGGQTAMLTQIRSGALTFMHIDGISLSGVVPAAAIQGVGYSFKDSKQAFVAMDGELGAYIRSEIHAQGMYAHDQMFEIGMRNITMNPRAIAVPDDLVGIKIRTPPGRLSLDLFKAFGASPVGLNFADVYTSLQTKLIDGQENATFLVESGNLFEVQRYLSMTGHQWSGYWLAGNLDVWNKLPPAMQAIITRNFTQYALEQRHDNELLNVSLVDKLARRGMIVNRPETAPFRAKLGTFYQHWKGEFGPRPWAILEKYVGPLG